MSVGEFELIERFFSRPGGTRGDVVLGVGDDAAIVRVPPGEELIVAADTVVSGVHFPQDMAPEHIGYRALAANLSDMAAMGAVPAWFTLSLTLPEAKEDWLSAFSRGMLELAAAHNIALIGGDTTSGPLTICVQILGLTPAGTALRRSGARAGDAVFVSGSPGDAAAGLRVLSPLPDPPPATGGGDKNLPLPCEAGEGGVGASSDREYLLQRFLKPTPRVALGIALRGIASAAIDVSDGLLGDLGKLAAASGMGARLEIDDLPLSEALVRTAGLDLARTYALTGGDDYELCFTVPPDRLSDLQARMPEGTAVLRIGTIEKEGGVRCYSAGRIVEFQASGFDHFRR